MKALQRAFSEGLSDPSCLPLFSSGHCDAGKSGAYKQEGGRLGNDREPPYEASVHAFDKTGFQHRKIAGPGTTEVKSKFLGPEAAPNSVSATH